MSLHHHPKESGAELRGLVPSCCPAPSQLHGVLCAGQFMMYSSLLALCLYFITIFS
ncbi:hypothetical protein [Bacillus pumilus]|uniref:hypothetical protein n=1 Tax=Bacillus pumilus TaxID=1408 RepID=UPI0016431AFB|nr:hypothetical protein [Bacillus pumilus]